MAGGQLDGLTQPQGWREVSKKFYTKPRTTLDITEEAKKAVKQ